MTPDELLATINKDRADIYELFLQRPGEIPLIAETMRWFAQYAGLPAPPNVLDIGCGPGRLLRPLQQLGWQVSGVEPDPVYRARANTKATVYQGSFHQLPTHIQWDLLLSLNGPLTYLTQWRERREALRSCHQALAPGGWLFLELPNFLFLLKNYQQPAWQAAVSGDIMFRRLATHSFDFHEALWLHEERVEWRQDEAHPWSGYTESYRFAIINPQDLIEMLYGVGFSSVIALDGWRSEQSTPYASKRGGHRINLAARR